MNEEIRDKTVWLIAYLRSCADDPEVTEGELREHLRKMTDMVEQILVWNDVLHDLNIALRRAFWASSACAVVGMALVALHY